MEFKSNGKLLITGEYLVLDGAKSLALPTTYGQQLIIEENDTDFISWKSYDELDGIWFEDVFSIKDILNKKNKTENEVSKRLFEIFEGVEELNPNFFKGKKGFNVKTKQDFNRSWGLGTSSTLINNIASWVDVNAYKLLELTFGGSGYDIACAQNDNAIVYQLENYKPHVKPVNFNPIFKDKLYFVYLNRKQNSREGITNYKTYSGNLKPVIEHINALTEAIIKSDTIKDFNRLITEHEDVISEIIYQKPVKEILFKDFKGAIKSLGAWGGDFVLATSEENPTNYFNSKGYHTIITYQEMIKT